MGSGAGGRRVGNECPKVGGLESACGEHPIGRRHGPGQRWAGCFKSLKAMKRPVSRQKLVQYSSDRGTRLSSGDDLVVVGADEATVAADEAATKLRTRVS